MLRRRALSICFGLLLLAGSTSAQLVRGTVTDASTNAPVGGAFVSLIDAASTSMIGVLSDPQGGFALRAPAVGTYRLRIERIGYDTEYSPPFEVRETRATTVSVTIVSRAIQLAALRAEGENRCRIGPELGARTAAVWEEIRKALRVTNWTTQQSGRTFRLVLHARTLEPDEMHVLHEDFHALATSGAKPFTTPSVQELSERGYVHEYADSINFFAPDADILLSDAFANGHCFRLVTEEDRLGLHFAPVQRRRVSDVSGTLWIDRRTLALQELEFEYDRLPYEGHDSIGGNIRFRTLDDGAVIVADWRIISPTWMQMGRRVRPLELREHGGRVIDAFDPDERTDAHETAVLTGTVYDSVSRAPLSGATVAVAGTRRSTRTDHEGRFAIERLAPGTYMVEIDHPELDELPRVFPPPIVTLQSGDTTDVTAATPSHATIHEALCRVHLMPRSLRSNPGILWGHARDQAYRAIGGVPVTVQWSYALEDGTLRRIPEGSASTVTTPMGRYVICGVPDGVRGEILLYVDRNRPERRRVVMGTGGVARIDFIVPAPSIGEPQQ